jgi:glycerol-3-phosphate dehydrogenase
MLAALRASSKNMKDDDQFDLLIVGGGATGAGVAVDAVSRGLRVALVERDDFSSGTSSKSTKLVHGGVRYLQKAIFEADYEQYKLVREALHERKIFLQTAPYLSAMLPIMLPIYKCVSTRIVLQISSRDAGTGKFPTIGQVARCTTSSQERRIWKART